MLKRINSLYFINRPLKAKHTFSFIKIRIKAYKKHKIPIIVIFFELVDKKPSLIKPTFKIPGENWGDS